MRPRAWMWVAGLAGAAAVAASDARAAEDRIALGELSVPSNVDRATLKSAAEGEIKGLDASHVKRTVVVSLAVIRASDAPVAVAVNGVLRDGKTGAMIAIVEGRASADGGGVELRTAVLRAAVRTAVRQIPTALGGR